MKYAIYIRINTATDNENVSITNQVTLFENFMKKNGIELYKIYSDIAGGSTLEREGIQQLMTDAKKKKFE
ncbi:recombinase family protein, partial [Solibacillus silvestris]